jgi:hypothetical protein
LKNADNFIVESYQIFNELLILEEYSYYNFSIATMRKTAFITCALSVMFLILGLIFILHEFPYSNYIMSISLLLLALSLIIFYTLDKQIMYIAGAAFCLLPIAGLFFTQLNMPGSKFIVTAGLVLFGLLFVPWITLKCYKK